MRITRLARKWKILVFVGRKHRARLLQCYGGHGFEERRAEGRSGARRCHATKAAKMMRLRYRPKALTSVSSAGRSAYRLDTADRNAPQDRAPQAEVCISGLSGGICRTTPPTALSRRAGPPRTERTGRR